MYHPWYHPRDWNGGQTRQNKAGKTTQKPPFKNSVSIGTNTTPSSEPRNHPVEAARTSFRLLATKTLLIISAPTVILAATILPIELNCRCKNELGYCWHEVNQESQLTPWIQTERTSLSLRVPLRRSHADYAWNFEPQQGCCAQNRHSSRHCGGTLAQRPIPNEIQHSFFPSIASWLSRGRSTR